MAEKTVKSRLAEKYKNFDHKLRAFGRRVKHDVTYVSVKEGIISIAGERTIADLLMGGASAFGKGVVGMLGLGAVGAMSAALTQMEHKHELEAIKDFYEKELCSVCKKEPAKLTVEDLETLAKGDPARGIPANRTIDEQLRKERRRRNFGIVFSVISSLTALAVVTVAFQYLAPILGFAEAGGAFFSWAKAGEMALKGGMGLLAYNAVKAPLHYLGDQLFGLDNDTTHDDLEELCQIAKEGKEITRQQVVEIFAGANPDIERFIQERFGEKFEDLGPSASNRATDMLAQALPIDALTRDINDGRISITELAFTVQGDSSGVPPEDTSSEPVKQGVLSKVWEKAASVLSHKPQTQTVATNDTEMIDDGQKKSWVAHVGGRRAEDRPMSHVQRLAEQPADGATLGGGVV